MVYTGETFADSTFEPIEIKMKQKSAFDIFTKPICWNEIKKEKDPH